MQNTGRQLLFASHQRLLRASSCRPVELHVPYRSESITVFEVPSGTLAGIRDTPSSRAVTVAAGGLPKTL